MPGKPEPEPWCPQPAGLRAVLAAKVSAPLSIVELVRDGTVIQHLGPSGSLCDAKMVDPSPDTDKRQWYLLKLAHADGHRTWSSPIWLET